MSTQHRAALGNSQALLNIIIPSQHSITAVISIDTSMGEEDLAARVREIFNLGLFGLHDPIFVGNLEVASARFMIRWVGDDKLPEMYLKDQVDFDRGLTLMEERGWTDILVAYCELD